MKNCEVKKYTDENLPTEQEAIIMARSKELAEGILDALMNKARSKDEEDEEMKRAWPSVVGNSLVHCVCMFTMLAPEEMRKDTLEGIIRTLAGIRDDLYGASE
jgi:hypothetical protein